MTVLDVTEFGATGDGSTDDRDAIQAAVDAAGAGDEVYFPATSEAYLVEGAERIIDVTAAHSGVTVRGDGPESRIRYGGGNGGANLYVFSLDPGDEGLDEFVLEDLSVDGGRENVDGSPYVGSAVQVHDPEPGAEGNVDITIRNVEATNCYGNGIDVRAAGTVVRSCTARSNRQHGFGLQTGNDSFNRPAVRFERCLAADNGFGGGFYGIDLSGGVGVAEECVVRDNRGAGATKCSERTDEVTYRRCRLADNTGHAFLNTNGTDAVVHFEDVVAVNHDECVRLSEDGRYDVTNGSELVVSDVGPDRRGGIFLTDRAVFDAGDATVWVGGVIDGPGVNSASSGSGSEIGTYYHAGNDGGAIGDDRNVAFGTVAEGSKADLDGVPTADAVGAWAGDAGGTEDGTTAQSGTADETGTGDGAWTLRWDSDPADWSIVAGSEFDGGHALEHEHSGSERTRRAISWDDAGTPADVEVLDKVRVPAFTDGVDLGYHARVHVRSSSRNGAELGYWVEFESAADSFRLASYTETGMTTLQRFGSPEPDTFFYRRFRAEGETLKVKAWPAAEPEPDGWDAEVTDSSHADGWVGVGSFDTGAVRTDVFSVATGGESAPVVPGGRPTVSVRAPADGTTVRGEVPVRIDAGGGDGAADVAVEYRVGGGSWSPATYDAALDAYTATWDATGAEPGTVTLEARATDADGATATAAVEVVVDADPSVTTLEPQDVTPTSATLRGDLRDLGGADAVDARFEWRPVDGTAWTVAGEQSLGAAGEFTHTLSGLDGETGYEVRAVVGSDGDADTGSIVGFVTPAVPEPDGAPTIEAVEAFDRSGSVWTRFDVDWRVSDEERDLDTVVTTLEHDGRTVAAESTAVTGSTASYTHVLRVRGDVDTVRVFANDTSNETASETLSV